MLSIILQTKIGGSGSKLHTRLWGIQGGQGEVAFKEAEGEAAAMDPAATNGETVQVVQTELATDVTQPPHLKTPSPSTPHPFVIYLYLLCRNTYPYTFI